jgi:predicted TIM-barrel fold metal-dependent hydrolase
MNVATLNDARQRDNAQRLAVIDCDIHPAPRSPADLQPWLTQRWRDHMNTFGAHVRQGLTGQEVHPRMQARGMRADALPDDGPAGSDLELMRRQHLDANGVECAMMIPLGTSVVEERNPHYAAALSHAANEWQLATWVEKDHRLRASVIIPQEHVETSVMEIDKRAADGRFRQIIMSPKPVEPLGRRLYWPIYEAACRAGLPIAFHPVLAGGGHPSSGAGWPTYYMQDHYTFGGLMQNVVASYVFEGVFEQFPELKIVSVENGFVWAPNLGWRMDKHFDRMRAEVPHLKSKPSDYVRRHLWFTTQPMEETENPDHLRDIMGWVGWDRLLFSSDYPHWDFDDPRYAFRMHLTPQERAGIFRENARALYRL